MSVAPVDGSPRIPASQPVRTPDAIEAGMAPETSVTFTIPIQVSISLGTPTLAAGPATARPGVAGPAVGLREGLFGAPAPPPVADSKFDADSLLADDFGWKTALSLALASRLSYAERAVVESTGLNVYGMETCAFFEADDTQCFLATSPGAVLLAFRGTEQLADWLANLNVIYTTRPYGTVHRGFLGAFQVVEPQLRIALGGFRGRKLLLTGHSLGGALAMIAAAEWQGTFPIDRIYTYGQPAVGRSSYVSFMESHYDGKIFRFVNDDDVVPQVPPTYRHVGKLIHFDATGNLEGLAGAITERPSPRMVEAAPSPADPPMLSQAEFDQLRASLLVQKAAAASPGRESVGQPGLEGFFPSVSDHGIDRYIAKIFAQAGG
ncbi:Lipase (class 3) [Aquisphaera giovannonii]|uniref:Lipase (Class 3) n=1 Tax=Aquisphaera giovannonii TaxID=406548 RepID=A0A5B9VYS1_9BACT|nr:lipase family protein [Aquisphaera giovannonii]QEH33147.1 Lipase (class 3) [Aquisphaera giovannonii]